MIVFLLLVIAFGVLLLSDIGRSILLALTLGVSGMLNFFLGTLLWAYSQIQKTFIFLISRWKKSLLIASVGYVAILLLVGLFGGK